jgi:O-antigen/teichoic acid export membrane protein
MGKQKKLARSGEERSYGRVAKIGAIWAFFRQVVSQLVHLPAAIVLARLLAPSDFGIAAAAHFFILLGNRLSVLGLNAAIVRNKDLRAEHLSSAFVFNLAAGAIVFLTLQLIGPVAGEFYRNQDAGRAIQASAFTFLIIPFGSVPMALLLREMRFRQTAVVEWVYQLVYAVSAILLAWWGFGFWSLIYGSLAAKTCQVITKAALAPWRPSLRFSAAALKEIVPFGAGVSAKRILEFSAQNLDSLVIGRILGITALGYYDRAFNLVDKMLQRLTVGPGVSFRIFSIIQDDPERFYRAYRKMVLSITLIGYPAFAGIILVAPQLVIVLFGEKWRPSVLPLQILAVGGALKLLNAYISSATQAKGMIWAEVWRQVLYATAIVVGIVLFSRWGVVGAAAAVVGAAGMMAVLMQAMMRRTASLTWSQLLRPQLPGMVASVCLVPVVLGVTWAMRATSAAIADWQLLLGQIVAAGLFYIAFVLFGRFGGVNEIVDETLADLAPRLLPIVRPKRAAGEAGAVAVATAVHPEA